jgi:hypothetical protein
MCHPFINDSMLVKIPLTCLWGKTDVGGGGKNKNWFEKRNFVNI